MVPLKQSFYLLIPYYRVSYKGRLWLLDWTVVCSRVGLLQLRQEGVAGLLGVAQQHGGVVLVEEGVVHGSIAHTQ